MSIAEWREMPKERPTRTLETRPTEVGITRYNGVEYAMGWLAWSEWRDDQILALRDRLRDTAAALEMVVDALEALGYRDQLGCTKESQAIFKRLKEEGLV